MVSEYSASAKSDGSGDATVAATEVQNGTAQRQQQQQQQRRQSVTTLNCSANGAGNANGGNNKMPNGGRQVCQNGTMPKLTDNNNNGIINNNSSRNSHSSCGTTISALSGLKNTGALNLYSTQQQQQEMNIGNTVAMMKHNGEKQPNGNTIRVGGGPPNAAAIESSGGKVNACSVVVLPLAAPPPPRSLYLFVSASPLLRTNMSSSPPLLRSASRRRHPQQSPPHSSGSTNANRHNSDENVDDEEEAAPLLQQRKQQAKKHRKTSQNFDEMADDSHQQSNDSGGGGGGGKKHNLEDGYLIVGKKDGGSSSINLHHQHRDHLEDLLAREANYSPFDTHLGFYGTAKGSQPSDEEEDDQYGGKIIGVRQTALNRFLLWLRRMRNELKDDFGSILLLLLLYLLQGVPLGLIAAIPLILQSKEITYSQQAVFSFAYWPFSMKLLWAPIVDSIYFRRIGRRKSWMVPCQYLIGLFLLVISYHVEEILGTEDKTGTKLPPNVYFLVCVFLPLNFLAATQDIAVDGWALTMLSRKNVGYASTCNVVGQTIGFFLGNVVFLTLQSKEFANKWIRSVPSDKGLVQFDGFVFFWGLVFLVTTTLVFIFKHEIDHSIVSQPHEKAENGHHNPMDDDSDSNNNDEELSLGVFETYAVLVKILCLKPMLIMVIVLLTGKIAFAATDGMTDLKLINEGLTTDKIASRSIFLTPLQIILPWVLGKQTAGPKPLNVFLWAYPYRLVMSLALALLVYWTPSFREPNGEYPYFYYAIWIGAYYLQQVSSYCIFLSMMAFNAQISDPKIGGTYMTLLNTLNNLGGNWPVTLFLSITDFFNRKNCVAKGTKIVLGVCTSKHDEELCKAGGDACEFVIDGYYISVAICVVVGLLWYRIFYRRIKYFQKIPRQDWRVIKTKSATAALPFKSICQNSVRTMRVVPIPANTDNYMYLIIDDDDKYQKGHRPAALVDPVNVEKCFEVVKAEGTLLEAALVTHHHWDHAGGTHQLAIKSRGEFSDFLRKQPLCIISGDAERVERTEKVIADGESVQLGTNLSVTAMYTPCHTSTHVCYYVVDQRTNERAVFTGDTLFVGGCGRFFEGTAEQMHHALNERLAALPDETLVYCGHEYTVANLRFALTVEPSNEAIRQKLDWAQAQRETNRWTVPSTIGEEKRHNVFMRVHCSAEVQQQCGTGTDPVAAMGRLRELKNAFKEK
ncbi:hypothetical protein niasHT_029558 [Heterodera trifolii]|uniref:Metallo-beta-lactamase domain-containing protein n=1 Tax=Heterodera trifolii TaxID=157864 RepID=A0ABD2JB07_9BILA